MRMGTVRHLRRSGAGLVLGLLASGLITSTAGAQLSFTWPSDSTIDVTRYRSPEECLAAVGRDYDRTDNSYAGLMRDTLPQSHEREIADANAPLPESVLATARSCSARFPVATAQLASFTPLLSLYLAAERDADADALVERRLKQVPAAAESERVAVLDSVAHVYVRAGQFGADREFPLPMFARPVRLAAAERAVNALSRLKSASWLSRLGDHVLLAYNAWSVGDTARQRRLGEAAIEIASSLTAADRRTNDFQGIKLLLDGAAIIGTRPALLDSLRQSTSAYIALYRSIWEQIGGPGTSLGRPLGESASPIQADFWFRRGDSTVSRPVKGKVNLVVFLDARTCFRSYSRTGRPICQTAASRLRRLARQFPDVEVTLVAQTRGWLDLGAPAATAADEAAQLQHTWLEEQQLPGVLAVSATDFWRLPGLDRRRIDRDTPNVTNYSFGQTWAVAGSRKAGPTLVTSFLLDQNGVVVETANDIDEAQMSELISILLARPLASRP